MQMHDKRGRFTRPPSTRRKKTDQRVIIDHNYAIGHMCSDSNCEEKLKLPDNASRNSWKVGRRVIEFVVWTEILSRLFIRTCSINVRLGGR